MMKLTDENLDYQDCRPGTPGRDPLESKILPDHVRKILERKAASEKPSEHSEDRSNRRA